MTEFRVITSCGIEKDGFDSYSEAEDAADEHANFLDCPKCDDGMGAVIEPVEDGQPQHEQAQQRASADGGETAVTEPNQPPPEAQDPEIVDSKDYDLPENGPSVKEDPLVWMPDEFTDVVDGSVAINRKGFEVLAHHYDIQATTEMVVSPVETDGEYCVHKAVATDSDGGEYSAYGEAYKSEEGPTMVRMSDTRAYKRAVSRATGVGMVAVEELQNDL